LGLAFRIRFRNALKVVVLLRSICGFMVTSLGPDWRLAAIAIKRADVLFRRSQWKAVLCRELRHLPLKKFL
jgi:hypothetical protein